MEIERLSARVEADTIAAEAALSRLDRKLDRVADDRTARVSIFYTENGTPGGGGGGGSNRFGLPDMWPGGGSGGGSNRNRGGGGGLRNFGLRELFPG